MQIRLSWWYFWSLWGSKVGPLIDNAPAQEGDLAENIGRMVLRRLYISIPMQKKAKQNLIILLAFLVALGLLGVPCGDGWVVHQPKRVIEWEEAERLKV